MLHSETYCCQHLVLAQIKIQTLQCLSHGILGKMRKVTENGVELPEKKWAIRDHVWPGTTV